MSLDVYLEIDGPDLEEPPETERIFVREGGATVEISRERWDELYPGVQPVTVTLPWEPRQVYEANITHNLGLMAGNVELVDLQRGSYSLHDVLWRPDENGFERAEQLVEPLRNALAVLLRDRDRLQQFNPANGWGDYDGLVRFVERYLEACEEWPQAKVSVSR